MNEVERTWKVGELARATGLSIRALRHYDEIGLLVPGRSESGHRVYTRADVERLYRVLAFRGVGLSLDEIGSVLDADGVTLLDTVRRHVAAVERDIEQRRRLLERLRSMLNALERSSAPTVEDFLGAVEAMTVVETEISDVVTRERWDATWELTDPYVVLLREAEGERILPIWIGAPEAAALVLQRRGAKLPRPLGHDLTVALLSAVDARVERVVIERLEDNTFFATVTVTSGRDPYEVDARPSDALNLAVRSRARIHVARSVFDAAGGTAWPDALEQAAVAKGQAPWTSVIAGPSAPPWAPVSGQRMSAGPPSYAIDADSPQTLQRAAAEARALGHGYVGDAHLLLGILAGDDGPASRLLDRHGITVAAVREATVARAPDAPSSSETMCLTAGAMYTMQRASNEARRRRTMDIAPMHLLLGLLDSPDVIDILGLTHDLAAVRDDARSELDS